MTKSTGTRKLPSPKRDQVTAFLVEGINSGRYAPGDRLPSGMQLVRHFGYALTTCQYALAEVGRLGLAVCGEKRHEGWRVTFSRRAPRNAPSRLPCIAYPANGADRLALAGLFGPCFPVRLRGARQGIISNSANSRARKKVVVAVPPPLGRTAPFRISPGPVRAVGIGDHGPGEVKQIPRPQFALAQRLGGRSRSLGRLGTQLAHFLRHNHQLALSARI